MTTESTPRFVSASSGSVERSIPFDPTHAREVLSIAVGEKRKSPGGASIIGSSPNDPVDSKGLSTTSKSTCDANWQLSLTDAGSANDRASMREICDRQWQVEIHQRCHTYLPIALQFHGLNSSCIYDIIASYAIELQYAPLELIAALMRPSQFAGCPTVKARILTNTPMPILQTLELTPSDGLHLAHCQSHIVGIHISESTIDLYSDSVMNLAMIRLPHPPTRNLTELEMAGQLSDRQKYTASIDDLMNAADRDISTDDLNRVSRMQRPKPIEFWPIRHAPTSQCPWPHKRVTVEPSCLAEST